MLLRINTRRHLQVLAVTALTLILLALPLSAVAKPEYGPEQDAVLATVEGYLQHRFEALVAPDGYRQPTAVDLSDDTAVALALDALELESAQGLDTGWADYTLKTRVDQIIVRPNTAKVVLIADVDYHYKSSPEIDSGIYNVAYEFGLRRSGNAWRIVAISSDYDGYLGLSQDVNSEVGAGKSLRGSVEAVRQRRRESLSGLVREVKRSAMDPDLRAAGDELVTLAAASYSYNVSRGASYAQRFAPSTAPRWFYYVSGGDCTNFVSQCVWAGYGGYVTGNDTQSKSNISNKVRMVPNVWHGGTGGGMTNWESVGSFWTHATSSKTLGPKATGFNNNLKYTSMSSSDLEVGNVLQVRTSSTTSYKHSVYVSVYDNSLSGWSRWFVCQHSSDLKNRKLTDVISAWGGSSCYMRRLRFGTASFNN